jgi:hypothetical protein
MVTALGISSEGGTCAFAGGGYNNIKDIKKTKMML